MDEIHEKEEEEEEMWGIQYQMANIHKNSAHTFWIKGNQQERKGRGVERSGTKLSSA